MSAVYLLIGVPNVDRSEQAVVHTGRFGASRRVRSWDHMLHKHVSYSHFPQFDRLEQILLNWPKLFEQLPIGTQPLHVEHDTVIILCQDETWVQFIAEHSDELVERLRPMIAGDVRLELSRLQPVLATPTEIFLARQLIVVLSKLRDLEVGF